MKIMAKEIRRGALPTGQPTLPKSKLDWFFSEIFPIPSFHKLLIRLEVMSLREVCQDWRITIDNFLETLDDIMEPDYSNYKSILNSLSSLAFEHRQYEIQQIYLAPDLHESNSLVPFLHDSVNHPRSPFLSRRASLHFMMDKKEQRYWEGAFEVLDLFGEGLRSLNVLYRSDSSTVEMLTTLKECLERAPQLTLLDFKFISILQDDDGTDHLPIPEFPPLTNLRRLVISFSKWPIYQPLTEYFDQIVSLNVRLALDFMDWYDPSVHSTFPRLQHLALCVNSDDALFKLQSLTSQLREVDIDSRLEEPYCPSVYLHILKHFSPTLATFKLHQDYNCGSEVPIQTMEALGLPDDDDELDFPHLKIVSLNITECGYASVDSLLKLSQPPDFLEVVIIECSSSCGGGGDEDCTRENMIEIHEYLDDLYDSNIWEVLPSLQEIQVRIGQLPDSDHDGESSYTRAMYDFIQKDGHPNKGVKRICRGLVD